MSLITDCGSFPDTEMAYTPGLKRPETESVKYGIAFNLENVLGTLTNPLPLCHPAVFRLAGTHHSLEIGRRAVVDVFAIVAEP